MKIRLKCGYFIIGMTKGDYIFLDVEIFQVRIHFNLYLNQLSAKSLTLKFFITSYCKQSSYWGDHDWKIGDSDDPIARKSYESLLRLDEIMFKIIQTTFLVFINTLLSRN